MIRTESEYRKARSDLELGRADLTAYKRQLVAEGLAPEQVERLMALSLSSYKQLEREVALYEKFRRGDLSEFQQLEDLERLLVAARIASKIKQRNLADALGVSETQVSRDERGDYHGVTLKRAREVLKALGVTVRIEAVTPRAFTPQSRMLFKQRLTSAKRLARQFRIVGHELLDMSAHKTSGAA